MKKYFLIAYFGIVFPVAAKDISAQSAISAVTVFPDRATISRQTDIQIPAGKNTVVFTDLPDGLLTDSIRVSGKGSVPFTIGSVETKQMFSSTLAVAQEKSIEDQLILLQDKRLFLESELKAINTGKNFIEGLSRDPVMPVPSDSKKSEKVNPDSWKTAWMTIQSGMDTLGREGIQKQIALRTLESEITALQQKLRSMATGRKGYKQVRVNIESKLPGKAELTLQYQIYGASWTPLYEARLDSAKESVTIAQYGNIAQRTGEDWANVSLTLSTAIPSVDMTPPVLSPRWLELDTPHQAQVLYRKESAMRSKSINSAALTNFAAPEAGMVMDSIVPEMEEAVYDTAVPASTEFSGVYEIKGQANVPADGDEYRFTIGDYTAKSEIRAETMPAQDASAYLISTLSYDGELPLLPGSIALFRDGAFIGNSQMSLLRPNEKLHLSFGQDDKIRVKYSSLGGEKSEGGVLTRDIKTDSLSRAEIQNLHAQPIKIAVYDILPIARNSDISVKIIKDKTSADYVINPNNKTGVIMWESVYQPKEKKTIDFGYSVTYPKDKILRGL